jgi:hypothetical protein
LPHEGVRSAGARKSRPTSRRSALHLETGACRVGCVIVFEECDYGFEEAFAAEAEANHHGCRVRFIKGERE